MENSIIRFDVESHANAVWNWNLFSPFTKFVFEWKTSVNPLLWGVWGFKIVSLVSLSFIFKKFATLVPEWKTEIPLIESLTKPKLDNSLAKYKNWDLLDFL